MRSSHRARKMKGRPAALGALATLALLAAGAASMNQAFADNPDNPDNPDNSDKHHHEGTTKAHPQQGGTDNGTQALTLSGDTAPADPRSATAALRAAVAEVADGTASNFGGFSLVDAPGGSLTFTPADGSPAGDVDVHLWDAKIAGTFDCTEFLDDCNVTTGPDGAKLRTYILTGMTTPNADGSTEAVVTRYAERLVGDTLVKVSASNAEDLVGGSVTRPDPVLTTDQLTEIVNEPWWGADLPEGFAEAGAALSGFDDSNPMLWQG